jgi:hypothetical protein
MKKPLIILLGALVLGGIGAATYLLVSPSKSEAPKEVVTQTTAQKSRLLSWDDPAGFTFSYPEGVSVNKHDEDQQNYAHIEMTHAEHKGGLVIWAKDLPAGVTDTASWLKKDATLSAAVALDTTLGDVPAKKILLSTPNKRMVVGTVTDGLLFYVESDLFDEAYWQAAINTVTGSFAFKPTDTPAQAASQPSDDEQVDEEEILQ